ncbi:hypothetical protein CALCODRAFT_244310 [Calocera cornea HHB12733]|uniref:Splicing arginine serine-rich 12 n=1 Tax=Calocera cornea HHB12733 TaxID=1353952 RepID=A0A165GRG8_9BASI|nr:hypothetical protein CALCODRAFT_244310 [Calocera cornea HHB12733]
MSTSPRPPKRRRISRSPSPARSRTPPPDLPHGANEISESDYYAKNDEFRVWLRESKHKYFDELSGEKARSYFRKFVRAWNRGNLPDTLYKGIASTSIAPAQQTAFKWGFADKSNRAEREALERARGEVGSLTWGGAQRASSRAGEGPGSGPGSGLEKKRVQGPSLPGRVAGPSMPSAADLRLAQESTQELLSHDRSLSLKQDRRQQKDRLEELAPREVGRERMLEKKRERREGDRAFREGGKGGGDEGLEVDEGRLMGGDSFQDRIRQRDAARGRFEEQKRAREREREAEVRERTSAMRARESETMEMFKRMARERFGAGPAGGTG